MLTIEANHQKGGRVLGAVDDSINDLLLQPATILGLVGWVLGQLSGPDNEADFWKGTVGSGGVESIKTHKGHALLSKRRVLARLLVLVKPGQWVVIEVVGVLVELPRDTGFLVKLIDGLPLQGITVDTPAITT